MKRQAAYQKSKRKKNKRSLRIFLAFSLILLTAVIAGTWYTKNNSHGLPSENTQNIAVPDWIKVDIIEVDGDSRRGVKLEGLKDIAVHYVGNPNTTAKQNRDFYANPKSEVSSHFVIGMDGEIIQCIPLDEKSSATNERNRDTISIEVCHPDDTGKFTEKSYASLVKLTSWLCTEFNLGENNIIRHFDVTGKECPRYFVQHEDAWETFVSDVKATLK